ncbi:uncharacterized protein LOC142344224 [Convolutriloba macropyga]|uniref:uncharacterized protein LOC142344224 n=1 Tax=Convolutriloba macropyga TaxID=536237 RepID=UPI003F528A98
MSHLYTVGVCVKERRMPRMQKLTEIPKDPKKLEKWEDIRAKEFATLTEKKRQENIEERVRKIENRSILIDKGTSVIKGELQDMQKSLGELSKQIVSSKPKETTSDNLDGTASAVFERELTCIKDNNSDLRDQVNQLESKLAATEENVLERVTVLDARCQRMESMLEAILHYLNQRNQQRQLQQMTDGDENDEENPLLMVDLEMER